MSSSGLNDREPRGRLGLRGYKFLARCLITVAATRLGLSTIGYRRLPPPRPCGEALPSPQFLNQVRVGVTWAARHIPQATCLTQAVACRYLLARHGFATTLRIGVKPDERKTLAAHAWLLCGEEVVIGGDPSELETYSRLADFQAGAQ